MSDSTDQTADPSASGRRVRVIGVGAGSPRHLTGEAAAAVASLDAVLVLDKGDALADLAALRTEILNAHGAPHLRTITVTDPPRDLPAVADRDAYAAAVAAWHEQRVGLVTDAFTDALTGGGSVGILVWGDPSLYDSTLRVLDEVRPRLPWPVDVDVVAGVSSLHLLTAAFAIPLNRVGAAVTLTTGRRLAETPPSPTTDVVVFLDGRCAFTELDPTGIDLHWGAYLGSDDELLVGGPLDEVADEVVRVRAEARERKGWMFDTYLLRWRG